jgi:hypothetical protein
MFFNDYFSSTLVSRQSLSIQTNINDMKQHFYYDDNDHHHRQQQQHQQQQQQQHHYYYHHHYYFNTPMSTFTLIPSMPMIDRQVPVACKENLSINIALKLRRCVTLFLQLIGKSFNDNLTA